MRDLWGRVAGKFPIIMFELILSKNRQNQKQTHKTWTKRRTNYAYRLAKTNRNEQSQKTRPNDKNRNVQFCQKHSNNKLGVVIEQKKIKQAMKHATN